jgi:hypothetical protein
MKPKEKKNTQYENKNPTRFYCKEKIEKNYDNKMYPRLVLNRPKVMRIYASIYTHWALSSRNFQYVGGPCSPMCAHVHPRVNYE